MIMSLIKVVLVVVSAVGGMVLVAIIVVSVVGYIYYKTVIEALNQLSTDLSDMQSQTIHLSEEDFCIMS